MAARMRGHQSHNRMDDRLAARGAIAAAYADEQDWLHAEFGDEHIGLKRMRRDWNTHPFYSGAYVREVMGQDATDEPFVSIVDGNAWYRGKTCDACGCPAEMHERGSRICMDPECGCTDFYLEEEIDYGARTLEVGGVEDLYDWEMKGRSFVDPEPDLGELYERARRDDGDNPDVTTFLARYSRGAYN